MFPAKIAGRDRITDQPMRLVMTAGCPAGRGASSKPSDRRPRDGQGQPFPAPRFGRTATAGSVLPCTGRYFPAGWARVCADIILKQEKEEETPRHCWLECPRFLCSLSKIYKIDQFVQKERESSGIAENALTLL